MCRGTLVPPATRGGTMRKLVGLMVVAAIAAAVVAGTAEATKPQPQTLQLSGVLTGPDTISGTWRGHGVVEDAGTYTETFRFVGDTIKVDKVLVGARGTITLHVHAVVV